MYLALLIAVIASGCFSYLFLLGNFHEVLPKELYRSGQLNATQIAYYKNRYGIRTILNLRGENTHSAWYAEEIDASKKLGLRHINFRMSAKRELSKEQVLELLALMRDAPKPLLVHCHSGANRTGLASALYLAAIKKRGEQASENQISLRYGHFPLWFTDAYAMDRTFENMEQSLFGWAS